MEQTDSVIKINCQEEYACVYLSAKCMGLWLDSIKSSVIFHTFVRSLFHPDGILDNEFFCDKCEHFFFTPISKNQKKQKNI